MTMADHAVAADELEAAFDKVRALILGHGGDIAIEDLSADGVLRVRLSGACEACPNIAMTYVGPIRTYLLEVAGVTEVECRQVRAGPRALARMARLLNARPFGT